MIEQSLTIAHHFESQAGSAGRAARTVIVASHPRECGLTDKVEAAGTFVSVFGEALRIGHVSSE